MNTIVERKPLPLPGGHDKVLLHSCCAPCSGEVMEAMLASGIDYTIFFYNPNIHPLKEYELRKSENIRFVEQFGVPFIDADYDRDNWFERARGMEHEPERGVRCTMCFDMRFERTASLCARAWLPGDHQLPWNFALEEHAADQRLRRACGGQVSRPDVLGLQLAQGRWLRAHDRDQQARELLPAGVLRLRLLAARHEPAPGGKRSRAHSAGCDVLRRRDIRKGLTSLAGWAMPPQGFQDMPHGLLPA